MLQIQIVESYWSIGQYTFVVYCSIKVNHCSSRQLGICLCSQCRIYHWTRSHINTYVWICVKSNIFYFVYVTLRVANSWSAFVKICENNMHRLIFIRWCICVNVIFNTDRVFDGVDPVQSWHNLQWTKQNAILFSVSTILWSLNICRISTTYIIIIQSKFFFSIFLFCLTLFSTLFFYYFTFLSYV